MLEQSGAVFFEDIGYLLPHSSQNQKEFAFFSKLILSEEGRAQLLYVLRFEERSFEFLCNEFSKARTADYIELIDNMMKLRRSARKVKSYHVRFRERFEAIAKIDFFPTEMQEQAEEVLLDLEGELAWQQ